ncbi:MULTISPECIES: hypothetical protein [Rhodopseudomonas]|uniref:Uncharacterized protein n=1 Tax=Rhodopseudomonas palustris TaxID=1076 RepID=A0A0D7EPQ3_RHOPL|nr:MULTISPECIES: hypothetical protein [Rhodopseudomonas]KIZ41442.1 hypothetical protein OO17_15165 [Rhodopseudomonas palustris]MDF3810054.1 hypothetical protein [Rhodopseudomonas sp. BAL398]WOK18731.1 hypothetical protein RBJ75_04165 [Rhodopseudomonas sp. BAL398]
MTSVTPAPFDWNEEVVAIPHQRAITVYVTERLDVVVIRQQGEHGAPDATIEVASRNCIELAATILREAGQHRFRIVELDDDEIVGRDGNRMHIPQAMEGFFDKQ